MAFRSPNITRTSSSRTQTRLSQIWDFSRLARSQNQIHVVGMPESGGSLFSAQDGGDVGGRVYQGVLLLWDGLSGEWQDLRLREERGWIGSFSGRSQPSQAKSSQIEGMRHVTFVTIL